MNEARRIVEAMHGDLDRFSRHLGTRSLRLVRESMDGLREQLLRARLGPWGAASNLAALSIAGTAVQQLQAKQARSLGAGLPAVARASRDRQADLLHALDAKYNGAVRPLRFDSLAWLDTQTSSSIRLRQYPRSFARYGAAAVTGIEEELAKLALIGKPWTEARGKVWRSIRGVVGERQWMVDRILRTETAAIYNGTALAAMEAEDTPEAPMLKRLVAIFDAVTGRDSVAVHGQLRRVREPFQDPKGRLYQAPPNRPHDREIVVPHRASWGERVEHLGGPVHGDVAEKTSTPAPLPAPPAPPVKRRARPDSRISMAAASVLLLAGQVGEMKRRRGPDEVAAPPPGARILLAELERARIHLAAARLAEDASAGEGVLARSLSAGDLLAAGGLAVRVVGVREVGGSLRIVLSIGDATIVFVAPREMVLPLRRVAPSLRPSAGARALAVAAISGVLFGMVRPPAAASPTVAMR